MTKYDPDAKPDDDARSGIAQNAHGDTIVPMEAAISARDSTKLHRQAEFSEQIIEERSKRAGEPLRMEGLKPLPPEMMSQRTPRGVIPGGAGALDMVPSMRKTIPAPFKRPRIDIDHHGKTWGYLRARDVAAGDIVVDFGKIERVTPYVHHEPDFTSRGRPTVATREGIILTNIAGDGMDVDSHEQLRVFRVHEEAAE